MSEDTTKVDKKVIIYTTPTCHFCHLAMDYFGEKGIKYTQIDVATNVEAQKEMIAKTGQLAVPVIDIDGQVTVGFNLSKVNELLELDTV